MRKGITFHDGQLLTAHDIVHTFERLQSTDRRTLYRDVSKQILSIEAVDSLTVCFQLKDPHELFLSFLTTSRAAIVPSPGTNEHKMKHSGDVHGMQKPVGTGPFKVTAWDDHLCRLEAFSSYFQGRAHMDRVDILQIPWSASAKMDDSQDIETPFFHLVHNPSSSAGADWTQISAGVMVHKLLTCNTQKTGPLNDPEVRAHLQSCLAGMYRDDRHGDNSEVVETDFSAVNTRNGRPGRDLAIYDKFRYPPVPSPCTLQPFHNIAGMLNIWRPYWSSAVSLVPSVPLRWSSSKEICGWNLI